MLISLFKVATYVQPSSCGFQRPTLEHPVTNKYVCGVKGTYRSGRVVGGEDATPGEWCWQVLLTMEKSDSIFCLFVC